MKSCKDIFLKGYLQISPKPFWDSMLCRLQATAHKDGLSCKQESQICGLCVPPQFLPVTNS